MAPTYSLVVPVFNEGRERNVGPRLRPMAWSVLRRWASSGPSLERDWSSTIVVIAALGGANMLMTGVVGLYVGRIYAEAKGRPLSVVERMIGFDDRPACLRRPAPARAPAERG